MKLDALSALAVRIFFGVAFALLALATWEVAANAVGYTVLRGAYRPGRLLDYAVILLIFVVAILLRQIRDRSPRS